jgi:hypothetical protein
MASKNKATGWAGMAVGIITTLVGNVPKAPPHSVIIVGFSVSAILLCRSLEGTAWVGNARGFTRFVRWILGCVVVIGVMFMVALWSWIPAQENVPQAPFAIFVERIFDVADKPDGMRSDWWIADTTRGTICAVKVMAYMRVVNKRPFPVTISRFDVELARQADGEFTKFPVIGFTRDSALIIGDTGPIERYVNRDFLLSKMTEAPMQPNVPIRGWVPLDFPQGIKGFDGFKVNGRSDDFKVSIMASDGVTFSVYPKLLVDQSGILGIPSGKKEDFSKLKVEQTCSTDEVW